MTTPDLPPKTDSPETASSHIEKLQAPEEQQTRTIERYPFYGNEPLARLCARFVTHLFASPPYPSSTTHPRALLPHFIAYALHRTKLDPSIAFAALVILQRLKGLYSSEKRLSGHRLFITAYMVASKSMCDEVYSNNSWGIVAQRLFPLEEINRMEREMCDCLDWDVTINGALLKVFREQVSEDFSNDKESYPNYALAFVSRRTCLRDKPMAGAEPASPITNPTRQDIRPQPLDEHTLPSDQTPIPLPETSSSSSTTKFGSRAHHNDTSERYPTSTTPLHTTDIMGADGSVIPSPHFHYVDSVEEETISKSLEGRTFAVAVPSTY
ncbi:hypothetical protein NMY22_g5535 [Coprinellus aureogranulatus]|nr:hypothetical protein NMY22_g5535 [Coprinellus aureogranulatus]